MPAQREKKPKVFTCSSIFIEAGESQMRKGDKGMKVLGVILILAINVAVFGGAVSAEDLSVDLTKSFADVTLTLYVHEGSASGPLLSGARVTGQDGAGNSFDKTTGTSGY
ncbi:MAG: hypothetical protein IMF19_13635, partial [Proteobacteria bacterium]|nr:hypothetical protein [Pseudomonadota bacterium]